MIVTAARLQTRTPEQRFARAASSSGCPRSQVERFLRAGYVPLPRQLQFHAAAREADRPDGPTLIGFGGRRGPGKSYGTFAQVCLDDCQRFPGLKFLFLRRVGKAAKESFEDLRQSVLPATPHEYSDYRGLLTFPNGSRILVGHFNTDKDIDNYLGVEYDGMAIEEANTLSKLKLDMLFGSMRTSKAGWRPRAYLTFNPGGVGHAYIKQTFITPYRRKRETNTRFIPAGATDNPFLNPEYLAYLHGLTGWLRRAWLDGDWDIVAGQFFSTWREDIHVMEPFVISGLARRAWCALDYGFVHPTSVHLLIDFDGMTYGVDEYIAQKRLTAQNAAGIKDMLGRHGLTVSQLDTFVAGHDVFSRTGHSETTIAEQYADEGIFLERANVDRVQGAAEILRLLGDEEQGIASHVRVFSRCTRLIETLPALEHNPARPEDVLKVDADEDGNGGDDAYDSFRYAIMAVESRAGFGKSPTAGYRG